MVNVESRKVDCWYNPFGVWTGKVKCLLVLWTALISSHDRGPAGIELHSGISIGTEQSHLRLQLWRVKPGRIYSDGRESDS